MKNLIRDLLPMSGIRLDPPAMAEAITKKGGLKPGAMYYISAVRADGKIAVIGGEIWHDMASFVSLHEPTLGSTSDAGQTEQSGTPKPKL